METHQPSLDKNNIKHDVIEDPNSSPLKKRQIREYTGTKAKYISQLESKLERPEVYKEC